MGPALPSSLMPPPPENAAASVKVNGESTEKAAERNFAAQSCAQLGLEQGNATTIPMILITRFMQ
jgi:hypothetical protein